MKLLVYGTLRKGCALHYFLDKPRVRYLGTKVLYGFDMYNIGNWCPFVSPGKGSIVVEIYDVQSDKVIKRIYRLERSYEPLLTKEGTIFIQREVYSSDEKIPHGDWVKYYRGKNVSTT